MLRVVVVIVPLVGPMLVGSVHTHDLTSPVSLLAQFRTSHNILSVSVTTLKGKSDGSFLLSYKYQTSIIHFSITCGY